MGVGEAFFLARTQGPASRNCRWGLSFCLTVGVLGLESVALFRGVWTVKGRGGFRARGAAEAREPVPVFPVSGRPVSSERRRP